MHYAGRPVTHRFADLRQAVAYALNCQRGPQLRRQDWGQVKVHGDRNAGSMVAAAIRGDLGIEPGSSDWRALSDWAFRQGPKPTAICKKLRAILGQADLLADQRDTTVRLDVEDVVFVDVESGEEMSTFREEKE